MNGHDSMAAYVAARSPELAPRRTVTVRLAPRRRGLSVWHLVAVAIVGALIGLWISPGRAYADPVPATAGGVYVSRIDPAPAGPRITVTLSSGRTDILRPCRFEDGRRCYWQADRRGNNRGHDLLVLSGRVFRVDLSWIGGAR